MVKCPHCGGEMDYLPGTQIIKCEYCGSEFSPIDTIKEKQLNATEHKVKEERKNKETNIDETYEAHIFTCPQCGGSILSTDEAAVTFCSFCGSQVTLQSRLVKMKKPERIIPFKIGTEESKKAYLSRVRRAIFAPSSMKKDLEVQKFRGIYMPYWSYSVEAEDAIVVDSIVSHTSGSYKINEKYRSTIQSGGSVDGITYDAAAAFSDEISQSIAPYDMSKSEPFNPAYMSSFYADKGDVGEKVYEDDALEIASQEIADTLFDNTLKNKGVTKDDIIKNFATTGIKSSVSYLPVWFLAVKNKKGDRISYAAVNGQTGKTAVDLPVDFMKYLIGSLIIAVPIFLLLTMVVTITPTILSVIVMILSGIAAIITNVQLNTVYVREKQLDDEGLASTDKAKQAEIRSVKSKIAKNKKKAATHQSVGSNIIGSLFMIPIFLTVGGGFLSDVIGEGAFGISFALWIVVAIIRLIINLATRNSAKSILDIKAPFSYKLKTIWKPLAGILICGIVMIVFPVDDLYYYLADIVAIILAGWTVLDIIRCHNKLTLRKLPQFGKRGGDEHEY